jgi:TonB family protein
MKYRIHCALLIGLCAGQAAWADLTMKHRLHFKFGAFLPPAALDAMKQQLADQLPTETVIHIKGKKAYTSMGRVIMIADYGSGIITLLDPAGHRFATSPLAAYADQIAAVQKQKMPVLPAQVQQMFENIKFDVKTDKTGKKARIQGIDTEENLLTVSMEIPNPSGVGMQMRMEMHQWIASAEEVNRVPALKELEMYAQIPKSGLDPVGMMSKALGSFPGMADKLRGTMAELMKYAGTAMLRTETAIYMPGVAQMMGGGGDQPFTEYDMELTELSSADVPAARFDVPAGYQEAPMEELIGTMFPTPKLPSAAGNPKAATPARMPPLPPGVMRVGNGVSAPVVLAKNEPSYTEEARAAKIQGAVVLNVVVGEDGSPRQVSVLRSLDPGLDQKAVETVSSWKFRPGMKDGKPVAVQAQIEVNFRLM